MGHAHYAAAKGAGIGHGAIFNQTLPGEMCAGPFQPGVLGLTGHKALYLTLATLARGSSR